MNWYLAKKYEEGCGDYGCGGCNLQWIIAANSTVEARTLLPEDEDYDYNKTTVQLLLLPDLKRKKKAFIYNPD